MTTTIAKHLEILKAHNAWRRGATLKLEVSPKEIGDAIDCAIGVMEVHADCTRSHPHELMSPTCELRTQLAKANNENAHLQAERDALADQLKSPYELEKDSKRLDLLCEEISLKIHEGRLVGVSRAEHGSISGRNSIRADIDAFMKMWESAGAKS